MKKVYHFYKKNVRNLQIPDIQKPSPDQVCFTNTAEAAPAVSVPAFSSYEPKK